MTNKERLTQVRIQLLLMTDNTETPEEAKIINKMLSQTVKLTFYYEGRR